MLLCIVLVPALAVGLSLTQQKKYTASASLLFRDPGFDQKVFGSTAFAPSSDPNREAATNVRLVSLDVVAARAAKTLGGAFTPREIRNEVKVGGDSQSDVVAISANDPNPRRAARIANAFGHAYVDFRRDADRSKVEQAAQLVRNQLNKLPPDQQSGAQGRSLLDRADQLDVLRSLQTGNAEVVQSAVPPTTPSSPKTIRNAAIGLLLGLLLSIGLAFLLERLDRRIKRPEDLEVLFSRPVLGAIPESRALQTPDLDIRGVPPQVAEAFRLLRANLRYFNIDRDIRSVLVTSAAPGDGKSTVAWYLACAAVTAGRSALMIEADLRHPSIGTRLGFASATGLSQLLAGHTSELGDVISQVPVANQRDGSRRTLDVIFAGALPPNPTDLMESHRMKELLQEAERTYDLVVIDTPPTSVVPDAIPLVTEVSGVIVVGRMGKTTRDQAAHLRTQLANLDAPTLGVVVNSLDARREDYGYGYGDTYGSENGASAGSVAPEGEPLESIRGFSR
jgi:capsular exopolysaccharide synthesis family protein